MHTDTFKIKSVLKKVKKLEVDVILKDLTTIDVKQLGYYVIKVIIPELVPVSGTYGYYHWGGNRLYKTTKISLTLSLLKLLYSSDFTV